MLGILKWSWKTIKPLGLGVNKKISATSPRRPNVSWIRCEFVSSTGSMKCTHASGLTSRRGARYGWGAIISVSRVLDRLLFNPKRVIFNLCRNPKRCDSNCATSLMMSSNPVIFVAGRTHSCGQSRSTLDCMFLSICNRILLSVVGIASLGRLSNFSVRRWHTSQKISDLRLGRD